MRGAVLLLLLLGYFKLKVVVCDAEGDVADQLMLVTDYNDTTEAAGEPTESPLTEDKCLGYYDVMGQWDPPFACTTGSYLYCCGTCGFRFCCAFRSSRLDQTTCKNYDTPPWMMTGRPPPKVDMSLDASKDKTNMIVYVICGVVAIMALIGIFTKLGLEKTHRPQQDNTSRAVAHVIRHPASDHMDGVGLAQHYENIHTRVTVKSVHIDHVNNMAQTSGLVQQPYPDVGQLASPYEQQQPGQELNQYATLKAVEKANESFYGNRRQLMEMATKGGLPMEALDLEPEPSNPYSPPRQPKQNGHRYKNHRSHSSQSLCYGSGTAPSPLASRPWESTEAPGLRHGCIPKRLCIVEKEVRSTRYVPPRPYFVTNSKTEVTV